MQLQTFLTINSYWVAKIKGNSLTIVRVISMPASVSPSVRQDFDYSTLDATTSQFVQQQTGEIRALMKRTAQDIIEVGQKLTQVKKQLGHGRFRDWLRSEFQWSVSAATRFMQVSERFQFINLSNLDLAPSALYELAAPSTPEAAREEALSRAKTGEAITHKAAQTIKQKYATPATKPKREPEPEPVSQLPSPTSTPALLLEQSSSKQQIVAILPRSQPLAGSQTPNALLPQVRATFPVNQPTPPVSSSDVPGDWWQLGGKHLLYCGDPNSPEFTGRITEKVRLLLAFPLFPEWLPAIPAKTRIIADEYLPQGKKLEQLNESLESIVLLYSNLGELVVCCFLPSPEILSLLNRHSRRGLFAEPDSKRVAAVISDWKGAGLKVERFS